MIFLKLILDDVCLGIGTMRKSWLHSLLTDEAKLICTCGRDLYKHFSGLNIGNYFEGCADTPKWRMNGNYLKNIGKSMLPLEESGSMPCCCKEGRAILNYSDRD